MSIGWKGTGKRAFEFPAGDNVGSAPPERARFRYNRTTGAIEVSFSGSVYASLATSTNSGWFRDTFLIPPQIEPLEPSDVLAFSSALVDVPAEAKVVFEDTPPVAGTVLDLVATGQGAAPWPALGSAALRLRRIRTAGLALPQELCTALVELDVHAADTGVIQDGICIRSYDTSLGAGSSFHEGIFFWGNADGNGHSFDHLIYCGDSPAWIAAANLSAGLPPPDILLYTQPNGFGATPGEPSGSISFIVGNTTAILPPNIELQSGIDLAVPAVGPHGTTRVQSRATAQIPLTVQGFAAQVADLQRWITSTSVVLSSIGPNGEITANAIGAAAGSDSTPVRWQGVTSGGARQFAAVLDAAAGVDTSFLAFTGPGGQQLRLQWDGANRSVAVNGGPGAATTARPGQMTDNTGAANTGIAASLTAGVWDAGQVQLVEEAIASLVARVNYLEQKILDFGLSV